MVKNDIVLYELYNLVFNDLYLKIKKNIYLVSWNVYLIEKLMKSVCNLF